MFIDGKKGFEFKEKGKNLRKQFIVFVTSLSTTLNELSTKHKEIEEYLKSINIE